MIREYAARLYEALESLQAVSSGSNVVADVIAETAALLATTSEMRRKVIFIGNGGSAAIASHAAADFAVNGSVRATALAEASALTCIANDYGYAQVFSRQLELQGDEGDVLVAISSSGESENIVSAALQAAQNRMSVVTMTGFEPGSGLRALGPINFWIPSSDYGIVETAHTALLHLLLRQVRAIKGREDRNIRRDTC